MKKVKDLFEAVASSPIEIATHYEDGRVGFIIPEYQRQYDWSEENINRLFYDTLNGFQRLTTSTKADAFTFLGTLILVKQQSKEEEFSGVSLAIVDGQQRLTTLSLLACALCESLRFHRSEIDFAAIDSSISKWLEAELKRRLFALYGCYIGSQNVTITETYPFPRIVRQGDIRANSKANSYYGSPIGKFLEGFASYFGSTKLEYIPPALGREETAERLAGNFQVIRKLVNNLNNRDWYEDTECEQYDVRRAGRSQCRDLFERLPDFIKDRDAQNSAFSMIENNIALHDFVRTLMFSAYFCNCVVLTKVITGDESAAFDIFDALNTTGQPLTALETLKPRVVNFENRTFNHYAGSESERSFKTIAEHLDYRFSKTTEKQTETKELIVTFALYLEGKKLSKDLSDQRTFLRKSYDSAVNGGPEYARTFMFSLAEATKFRRFYWEKSGIEELARFHGTDTVDEIQLLASLISDMNTSLVLPILLRYWNCELKNVGEVQFVSVLKSVIAFLVIRRAATGNTAGIDGDFRAVMTPSEGRGASRKFGNCAGARQENAILSLTELKKALKTLLEHKLKKLDKGSWVKQVVANPLQKQAKELSRFMILAAGHKAIPSASESGTWNKSGIKVSSHDYNFLNYKTWISSCYATVEHIAPETEPTRGWEDDLYEDNILRNSLGNLILLPSKENAAIGNDSWEKKKKFYLALTEKSEEGQNKRIEEARSAGIKFPNSTISLLHNGERLSLLEPLRDVNEWNREVVERRGKNIAELCWDIVWPWLN